MKIGYFGDGPWAQKAFLKLEADERFEFTFVALRYGRPDILLKKMACDLRIPVYIHPNVNSAEFMELEGVRDAQLFVSMSFDQIFNGNTINMPVYKTINCHAGKLPFYRGRNILNWVLINDEKEFGITVHYMDEGIDTGDILLQRTYPITDQDDYRTLLERAYTGCAEILYDAIVGIENGNVSHIKQTDIDKVGLYCGIRGPGDEVIDWNSGSREIFNFVRALVPPGPSALTYFRGHEIKIRKTEMVHGARPYKNTTGQVVGKTAGSLIVKTGDTIIKVTEFSCDIKIHVGDRLGKERDG